MKKSVLFSTHAKRYEDWFKKYPEVYLSEVAAVKEQLIKLPENIKGIEVGLGTGRFAQPLGIKEGIEPSPEMASRAKVRGIAVVNGTAENLPYKDLNFDFVLFVTICYLDNLKLALKETYRVLKLYGSVIIGFIDKEQTIGKAYEEKRSHGVFLKYAKFYTVNQVINSLKEAGFKNLEFNQTLFGALDDIKEVQLPKSGYGEGSFVVIKAIKK